MHVTNSGNPRHFLYASTALAAAFACASVAASAQSGGQWVTETQAPAETDDAASGGTITVTATRQPILVSDAPVTVSVISDEQIADELATDIRDLVRFEPGISVQRQPARFNAALSAVGRAGNDGFTVRGIGGNRVLIQVDGVRVPDGFSFGAQNAGRGDYVDIGLIRSVEFLRGPTSALYGSDGLAGAVSFITANPADFITEGRSVGGLARAAYSSADEEYAGTAILAGRSGALSAMVAYTRRDYSELDNQGVVGGLGATRTQPNPQDGVSDAVLARIVYDPAGGHRFRLTGEWLETTLFTDALTGRSATVDLLQARDSGRRRRVSADWSWDGNGVIESARAAVYWQDATDVQFTDEDRTPAADRERLNSFENRVYGVATDVRFGFATGPIDHNIVVGADASSTRQQGLRNGVTPPTGETFPTRAFPVTDFTRAGAFVGDEIRIADGALTLFPSVRFDYYRLSPDADPLLLTSFVVAGQSGSRVSPKLGAVWRVDDMVRIFANYATGFKAPEPGQVNQFFENLAFGYTSRPNPNLGPERSSSFEGGVRFVGDAVNLTVTAFSARYRDFISQEVVSGGFTPANPAIFQFINLNRVEVEGAEARLDLRGPSGFNANLALSYAIGDVVGVTGTRSPLSTIDPLKLVIGIGWRDPSNRFGGQLIATHGAQKEESRTTGICTPACFRPGAFTIVDATLFARVTDHITLRAGVFNLFDATYAWWNDVRGLASTSAVTSAFTQPGRNASISLSVRF